MGNSPYMFVDPNGEIAFLAIVLIGATIGGALNVAGNWGEIDTFWEGLGYFGLGAAVGAGSVVAGAALAPVLGVGAVAGATLGAASGFVLGTGNTLINGGSFDEAIATGGKGALVGGITGGVIGGAGSLLRGKNFWTGFDPGINPTFNLKDAYSLKSREFWKTGEIATQKEAFLEKARGKTFSKSTDDTYYRYMGKKEVGPVENTNMLRGGRQGETYYTNEKYVTSKISQQRLSLEDVPEYGLKFRFIDKPSLLKNNSLVFPKNGQPGGGIEFMFKNQKPLIKPLEFFKLKP